VVAVGLLAVGLLGVPATVGTDPFGRDEHSQQVRVEPGDLLLAMLRGHPGLR
jgi:hypothetical protein